MNKKVGGHCSKGPREHPGVASQCPHATEDTDKRHWLCLGGLSFTLSDAAMWVSWTLSTGTGHTKDGRIKASSSGLVFATGQALNHRWPGQTEGGLGDPKMDSVQRHCQEVTNGQVTPLSMRKYHGANEKPV